MSHITSNIAELKGSVDFGIITIREDEFEAILERLPTEQIVVGRERYAMSRLRTVTEDDYVIASVRCLEPGAGQAQDIARTMIDELDPQWIVLVGIAGSIPDYEYTLGDVILASRLHDFSVSALIEGSNGELRQEFASGGGPMHQDVQALLANLPALNLFLEDWAAQTSVTIPRPIVKLGSNSFYGDDVWKKKVRDCLKRYFGKESSRNHAKAFTGSVASSGILLKDTQTASIWLQNSRDIKGIEMELAGVYKAAWGYNKPVLAIRGISDVVGFKRSPDWTKYACHTAAAFTIALLRSRPIVPVESRETSQTAQKAPILLQNQQVGVFRQKPANPTPLAKREELFSNLLEVAEFPKTLYSVATNCKDAKAVWSILNNEMEDPPNDWIYRAKTLYAFHDFSHPLWKDACDVSTAEPHATNHWANSQDIDRVNEFIELLTNCLKEFGKSKELMYVNRKKVKRKKKTFKFICYRPTSEYVGSALLEGEDFIDPDALVTSLKDKGTPLATYLLSKLTSETQERIERYPGGAGNLRKALANEFNEILKTPLYDPELFGGVFLRRETSKLISNGPLNEKDLTTLNRMLLEDAYWKPIARRELVPRRVVITSLSRPAPTYVFKAFRNQVGQISYYRHHAFRPQFLRLGGNWYLEITPSYHYTSNGYRVCSFYEELTTKIKRFERSGAVFRQVMFWARVLQDNRRAFFEQSAYPYLRFGDLLEFTIEYGIRDDVWLSNTDESEGSNDGRRRSSRQSRSRRTARVDHSDPLFNR